MKRIFIVFYLTVMSLSTFAQNSLREQIKKLEQAENEALLKGDTAKLKEIWDKDFMVNAPINRVSKNREEVLKLVKAGFISYSSFERDVEQILLSGDVVITMGSETVVPVNNRPHVGEVIKRRYTDIWQKKKGQWKLIARHANVICNQ